PDAVKVLRQPPTRGYRHPTRLACDATCRAQPARKPPRPPLHETFASPSELARHDTGRFPNVLAVPRLGCGKLGRLVWTGRVGRCHNLRTPRQIAALHMLWKNLLTTRLGGAR